METLVVLTPASLEPHDEYTTFIQTTETPVPLTPGSLKPHDKYTTVIQTMETMAALTISASQMLATTLLCGN